VSMWRTGVVMDDMFECGIARWSVKLTGRSIDAENRVQMADIRIRGAL
jgi:hypothetical protein